jgi:streptogramin lyase
MWSSRLHLAALVVLSGVLALFSPATSAAAEPASYELPDATHAGRLAITADGTAWFAPRRGRAWEGDDHSILGSVAADGTVSERHVAGFSAISGVAVSPKDALWVSGFRGPDYLHKVFQVGRLSPTGELLRRHTVGRGHGTIRSLAASADAVWLIRQGSNPARSFESIERVGIGSGKVRNFVLRPRCFAYALDVAPSGSAWFTQKCGGFLGEGASSKTSISRIEPDGKIVRRPIGALNYPVSLTIGPDGAVWFAAWRYRGADRIGRLTRSWKLSEFPIPSTASPYSIAVGPDGRLWFPGGFHRGYARALNSIGSDGRLGVAICADPTCQLEASNIARAPDGSLWYGLKKPNYNTGGGGSGLYIDEQIGNEAGFLGHLAL